MCIVQIFLTTFCNFPINQKLKVCQVSSIVQNLPPKMSLTYFIENYFQKNRRTIVTKVLGLQIHWYKIYSKIDNILILEEFLNFMHQKLFINIDDSNGQSNHTDVI